MLSTDKAWKRWGQIDPYFAVLSLPEFRRKNLNGNLSRFFNSGEIYVADKLERAQRAFGFVARGRALDFGCGVGRLLIPLAHQFDSVTGVDISPAMLDECTRNLSAGGIRNGEIVVSDDELSGVAGSFDFVNTYIVLQHIPVSRGNRIIDRLLGLVAHGGIASIQVTTARDDRLPQVALYWAQRYIPGIQLLTNIVKGRKAREPLVQMNEYSLPVILSMFERHGFREVSVALERQGRCQSVALLAMKGHDAALAR